MLSFIRPSITAFGCLVVSLGLLSPVWATNKPDLPATLRPADKAAAVILLEFSAPWCKSCKEIHPFVADYVKQHPKKVAYVPVNIDSEKSQTYLELYDIVSVPTYVLYNQQGKVLELIEDDIKPAALGKKLDQFVK